MGDVPDLDDGWLWCIVRIRQGGLGGAPSLAKIGGGRGDDMTGLDGSGQGLRRGVGGINGGSRAGS